MTIKDFFSFRQNRFFWANILAMAVVVVGLLFGVLKGLDIYLSLIHISEPTRH